MVWSENSPSLPLCFPWLTFRIHEIRDLAPGLDVRYKMDWVVLNYVHFGTDRCTHIDTVGRFAYDKSLSLFPVLIFNENGPLRRFKNPLVLVKIKFPANFILVAVSTKQWHPPFSAKESCSVCFGNCISACGCYFDDDIETLASELFFLLNIINPGMFSYPFRWNNREKR